MFWWGPWVRRANFLWLESGLGALWCAWSFHYKHSRDPCLFSDTTASNICNRDQFSQNVRCVNGATFRDSKPWTSGTVEKKETTTSYGPNPQVFAAMWTALKPHGTGQNLMSFYLRVKRTKPPAWRLASFSDYPSEEALCPCELIIDWCYHDDAHVPGIQCLMEAQTTQALQKQAFWKSVAKLWLNYD